MLLVCALTRDGTCNLDISGNRLMLNINSLFKKRVWQRILNGDKRSGQIRAKRTALLCPYFLDMHTEIGRGEMTCLGFASKYFSKEKMAAT